MIASQDEEAFKHWKKNIKPQIKELTKDTLYNEVKIEGEQAIDEIALSFSVKDKSHTFDIYGIQSRIFAHANIGYSIEQMIKGNRKIYNRGHFQLIIRDKIYVNVPFNRIPDCGAYDLIKKYRGKKTEKKLLMPSFYYDVRVNNKTGLRLNYMNKCEARIFFNPGTLVYRFTTFQIFLLGYSLKPLL